MEGDVCMNRACKDGSNRQWKKGWPLLSGGFARLCNKCGTAYEKSLFCHKFHAHESGWRKCNYCSKLIHCGCVVSRSSFEYHDLGGVGCVTCIKASQSFLMHNNEAPNESVRSTKNNASDRDAEHIDSAGEGKLMQLCKIAEASESKSWPQAQRDATVSCIGPNNQKAKSLFREEDTRLSNVMKQSSHSFTFTSAENNRPTWETKSMQQLLSLSDSLRTSSGNCALPSATEIVEGRLEVKESSPFPQGKSSYHPILPKPLKSGHIINLETNKDMSSQARIARPPAEGKGKNQLLSRYWPRITDQELEQLSGDLNSTVVPLFEKVLSISDASRIGRLVLPKACAEAYFPPISQSEGIPLHIQDVKGNEWTFQFRFWPNNNSRMYVLEGVTPCIQSMQLNAGDTVTFSRIDPGGKYVMGVRRRTSNFVYAQVASASAHSNDISTKETTFSGAAENLYSESSFLDLLQSRKGNEEPYLDGNSEHLHLGTQTADWLQNENGEEKMNNDTLQQLISVSEKKRTHKIGPKTKRLDIDDEDSTNLRLAWDKMDLLCPPPGVKPSIEIIDGVEIEEYNEPPVFREGTTVNLSPSESSIPASEQSSTKELENLERANKDSKKEKCKSNQQHKPSGLDALANAVILEDNLDDPVGVTTKHPRHRPGCTCIVCVQPPSGKARHKPTCTCLACLSMKRRFNTLRLRKKNHQSKHEVDAAHIHHRDEPDSKDASGEDTSQLEKEGRLERGQVEVAEPSARQIDLNCHPSHEDMQVD